MAKRLMKRAVAEIQDPVRIAPPDGLGQTREWKRGVITKVLANRSYEVQSDGVNYRRNRRHLRFTLRKQQELLELEDIAPEKYTESSVMKDKTITKTATNMKPTMESSDESGFFLKLRSPSRDQDVK